MNITNNPKISTFITKMTKHDAMAPIVALEATVVAGRTYQAYKRGKWDEARERFIEETMGSIVWLCGVASMNKLGDKLLARLLKSGGKNFDVGSDKILRTPFDNFMKSVAPKGFTQKQVALLKGAKVLTSIVLTNLFIGFVVPKLNQALTRKVRNERKEEQKLHNKTNTTFKGGPISAINAFTNIIENTNTGKLLSSDAGIAGGRMYNARSREERREIAIRDIGSIYFYMWAQGHVRNIMNYAECGHARRLNPETAQILDKHLADFIGDKSMSVEDFKKAVLGKELPLSEEFKFETEKVSGFSKFMGHKPLEVIKLIDAEKYIKDSETLNRAREMSKLQPKRIGELVLTKQQLVDAYNKAEINDPKLLDKVFTGFTNGANKDDFRYVSNNKLYKLKKEMIEYVENICKSSKDGKVDKKLLEQVSKKNVLFSGLNFIAGFLVAATFLSTLIPKIQYWFTKKSTGIDAFPGVYDFEHNIER